MAWASVTALGVVMAMVAADRAPAAVGGLSAELDPVRLQSALDDVRQAGIPGVFAEVREGGEVWRGASGVADVRTGRAVRPDLRHRIGSLTKTFTAAAVMRLVEQGRIRLDAPIGRYLPRLVPGERGQKITVRMLLNHTSGLPEYLPYAFPSLQGPLTGASSQSLDDNRFRRFSPAELIHLGVTAPPAGEPGDVPGVYSNTNYLLLGQLLEQVAGTTAERYITRNVIGRAGLRHTEFPAGARIRGPHSRMYEALFGLIDPPRDYSVYNMSWVSAGADLVSTVEDVNRFYRLLLAGEIVKPSSLAQMQRTVPVINQTGEPVTYGLGLHRFTIPGCGTLWGHDGTVWGAQTMSLHSADGKRQLTVALNLVRWNPLDSSGRPQHHPIDDRLSAFYQEAMCGNHRDAPR